MTQRANGDQAMSNARVPTVRARAFVACLIAVITAVWVWWGMGRLGPAQSDFDQIWFAARTVLDGSNPYAAIGPGRAFDWPWPLYYPPTAVLPGILFVWLPLSSARIAFALAMAWCFAFMISRDGWHRLVAVMSGAYLAAMSLLQWSPLIACAILAPTAFGWAVAAKPTLGLPAIAAASDRRALVRLVGWVAATTALSFAAVPTWLGDWTQAVSTATHVRPYVLRPGGFLLLLAALRWRRPEARLLVALAVVPNTSGAADALTLMAFSHTFREGLMLAILTHLVNFYVATRPRPSTFDGVISLSSGALLVLVLLPVLLVVLRRPNIGSAPAWLERLTATWPRWLRGSRPGQDA